MARHFDAIVIGSGLGGLTAGALHAQTGHRVLVLERNSGFGEPPPFIVMARLPLKHRCTKSTALTPKTPRGRSCRRSASITMFHSLMLVICMR
jgi:2-polyprenyl-6-methoxyphenol hydroxylase-like FAD-dependent oxidoreductase